MRVIHSPDPAFRGKVRKCFFGTPESPRTAILTPLTTFFRRFSGRAISGGWWRTVAINKEALVVLTPQGSAIIDAVSALDDETDVIFLGLSGSLGSFKIGDVVEPEKARLGRKEFPRSLQSPPYFPTARIATVGSLIESYQAAHELRVHSDCVDMETGHVFATAASQGKRVCSIQVISDRVPFQGFYEVSLDRLDKIIGEVVNHVEARAKWPNSAWIRD